MRFNVAPAVAGIAFFCGVVVAGFTIVPSLSSINDALTCLTDQCSDLAAQRSMALAAWVMIGLTALTAVVGALTLAFIVWTLEAARRSAEAAEDAAKSATESVELARESLATTQRYGLAQTRSYVTVKKVMGSFLYSENKLGMALTVKNSGPTPAHTIRIMASLRLSSDGSETVERFNVQHRAPTYFLPDIAAADDEPITIDWTVQFPEMWRRSEIFDWIEVELDGHIEYFDIYGDRHPYNFGFRGKMQDRDDQSRWNMHRVPRPEADSKPML